MPNKRQMREQQQVSAWNAPKVSLEQITRDGYDLPDRDAMPAIESALVAKPDGSVQFGRFTLRPTGIDMPDDLSEVEWYNLGRALLALEGSVQFWLGDWSIAFRKEWGEMYDQLAAETGYTPDTIKDYVYVCRAVQKSLRNDNLQFGHHKAVAPLTPQQQIEWLARAAEGDDGVPWSVSRLRQEIASARQKRPNITPLFNPSVKPKVDKQFEKLVLKASGGDEQARDKVLDELNRMQQWIQDVRQQVAG